MISYMRCILTLPRAFNLEGAVLSMKERIYTIPITEAFNQDSECPLCLCEKKLESDALEYAIGPSMMEPDSRIETNRIGFCTRHFTRLYNLQKNRLALGLVIDTHMIEQIADLEKIYDKYKDAIVRECSKGLLDAAADSLSGRKTSSAKFTEDAVKKLEALENDCAVCDRIRNNMDKFIGVTLYLFFKEPDFRQRFEATKGFCLKHMKMLLKSALKEFSPGKQAEFIKTLVPIQIQHLKRVQGEVCHFTEMFDYRNQGGDWKNSRDAVPRSIEKICGPCDLER